MSILRLIYLALFFLISGNPLIWAQTYVDLSVLSSGKWIKYTTDRYGVIKITFDQLESYGLPPGTVPAIYANNFGLLSYMNNDPYPDDLKPVSVYVNKGSDEIFNAGDYLLFFSESTHRWTYDSEEAYSFKRHYYSDSSVFFVTWTLPALEMSTINPPAVQSGTTFYYDYLSIHEIEETNLIKSGREWYERVSYLQELIFNDLEFAGENEPGEPAKYKLRAFARSADITTFRLKSGNTDLAQLPVSGVDISSSTGSYAREVYHTGEFDPLENPDDLSLEYYNNGDSDARAWLDYLLIHSRKKIKYNGSPLILRDYIGIGEGAVIKYNVESSQNNLTVWDITNGQNPLILETEYSDGILSFISEMDSLHTFVVFNPDNTRGPGNQGIVIPNQNLHSAGEYDGIIITHSLFRTMAEELADIHYQYDGLTSLVVTPEEIYNEFSGGIPDISAIRNFIRMVYSRNKNGSVPLRYLTLFGDGSYKNITPAPENPNYIPTYQTQNSHVTIQSYTSDDFYGLLDEDEGEAIGYIDIGIGRFPVSDTMQANIILKKIRSYLNADNMGSWKNMVLMIADDEDSNTHLNDAEGLSSLIENNAPPINIDKVYFDSFRQETTINGESYPDATEAINNRIKAGCLIFNYLGHGNELGLAHERVVKIDDINSWNNINKLPLFITATCEFSRFDDIEIESGSGDISQKSSAGEMVILNGNGGGIALMTTTRIVYSAPNYILNNRIYKYAFEPDSEGKGRALGDIFRLAKNDAGPGDNKRNFTLLGDPALKLAYPWHGNIITDSINETEVSVFNDTLKALSEVTIAGHITNTAGETESSLNGLINTVIYDKKYEVNTLANDGGANITYMKQDRSLYRGTGLVINGAFEIKALIPRDIDFTFGAGKISYYASSETADYTGCFTDIIIGGFSDISLTDTTGPEIRLFMNDTLFRSGGITDNTPNLLALISDKGGINTSGTGIGHDIISYLDEDKNSSVVLNNFYENNLNTYSSGKIIYPLGEISKGTHRLSLKAWDNYNNSTTEEIVFIVETEEGLVLNRLINYPNPFINDTKIILDHNRPDTELEITINIYSSRGSLIKRIKSLQTSSGFSLNPIIWDGRDDRGSKVGRGVYIYSVDIKTAGGEKAKISGRMVIL